MINFALIWSRFCPYYVTSVPVLRTQRSRLCPYYALFYLTLFSALLRTQRAKMLPIYTLKSILLKKLSTGYQWVEYLTALTMLNGDWPRLILISIFVHAYVQMFVCIYIYVYNFRIFMSQKTSCAYCFEKCGSDTAVSWNCNTWHPSKVSWVSLNIMATADRRRVPSIHVKHVVQTVSFRLWYDPIPGI